MWCCGAEEQTDDELYVTERRLERNTNTNSCCYSSSGSPKAEDGSAGELSDAESAYTRIQRQQSSSVEDEETTELEWRPYTPTGEGPEHLEAYLLQLTEAAAAQERAAAARRAERAELQERLFQLELQMLDAEEKEDNARAKGEGGREAATKPVPEEDAATSTASISGPAVAAEVLSPRLQQLMDQASERVEANAGSPKSQYTLTVAPSVFELTTSAATLETPALETTRASSDTAHELDVGDLVPPVDDHDIVLAVTGACFRSLSTVDCHEIMKLWPDGSCS